jgi:hypothetical protein
MELFQSSLDAVAGGDEPAAAVAIADAPVNWKIPSLPSATITVEDPQVFEGATLVAP